MTYDLTPQVLDILVDDLPDEHRSQARKTLLLAAATDPRCTGVPSRYAVMYIRGLLQQLVPYGDPGDFVHRALTFLQENEGEIDWCNRLGKDHEMESLAVFIDRYVSEIKRTLKND